MKRYSLLYVAWIALCAVAFVALYGVGTDVGRKGEFDSDAAGVHALRLLHSGDARYRTFEVVHVAFADAGEAGRQARWLVLCDRPRRSSLREAVVVEIEAEDGDLITVRRPLPSGPVR